INLLTSFGIEKQQRGTNNLRGHRQQTAARERQYQRRPDRQQRREEKWQALSVVLSYERNPDNQAYRHFHKEREVVLVDELRVANRRPQRRQEKSRRALRRLARDAEQRAGYGDRDDCINNHTQPAPGRRK